MYRRHVRCLVGVEPQPENGDKVGRVLDGMAEEHVVVDERPAEIFEHDFGGW